ncbi:hypothetical protein AB1Y20_015653 [Prymnesium parvum]|uniref:Uncharacterized protein n=1 Tax=Prymnesium parvum TaxID=97485 RepID=A0AB34JXD9_PRYPA
MGARTSEDFSSAMAAPLLPALLPPLRQAAARLPELLTGAASARLPALLQQLPWLRLLLRLPSLCFEPLRQLFAPPPPLPVDARLQALLLAKLWAQRSGKILATVGGVARLGLLADAVGPREAPEEVVEEPPTYRVVLLVTLSSVVLLLAVLWRSAANRVPLAGEDPVEAKRLAWQHLYLRTKSDCERLKKLRERYFTRTGYAIDAYDPMSRHRSNSLQPEVDRQVTPWFLKEDTSEYRERTLRQLERANREPDRPSATQPAAAAAGAQLGEPSRPQR